MEQERNLAYYLEMIELAPSYQDLVFFRNRNFDAIEATDDNCCATCCGSD